MHVPQDSMWHLLRKKFWLLGETKRGLITASEFGRLSAVHWPGRASSDRFPGRGHSVRGADWDALSGWVPRTIPCTLPTRESSLLWNLAFMCTPFWSTLRRKPWMQGAGETRHAIHRSIHAYVQSYAAVLNPAWLREYVYAYASATSRWFSLVWNLAA